MQGEQMQGEQMRRRIGRSGPVVSAIGLGCMGMSQFYGPTDDAQSLGTLQAAIDLGVDLIDTADVYGKGHNESLVGKAIRGRRDRVVLATKFGARPDKQQFRVDGRPEYVREACEASLARLAVEYIDLYYLHRLDPAVPIEETVGAMARLVSEGKVRHLGLSEVGPETLERAVRVHPIAALQSEYSIWTRDPERGVLDACRRLGVGFVAFSPLGRGFLTGAVRDTALLATGDRRHLFPRFEGSNLAHNLKALEAFEEIARGKQCTPGQLALAWLLARDECIVAIPGTRRIDRLMENIGALSVRLDASDLAAIERVCGPDAFAGERYQRSDLALVAR